MTSEREPFEVQHFHTDRGDDVVLDFMLDLQKDGRHEAVSRIIRAMRMLRTFGLRNPDGSIKKVRGDIWELRVRHENNPYRFLLYSEGTVIVILHAFHKKDEKTPVDDIAKAEARMARDRKARGL